MAKIYHIACNIVSLALFYYLIYLCFRYITYILRLHCWSSSYWTTFILHFYSLCNNSFLHIHVIHQFTHSCRGCHTRCKISIHTPRWPLLAMPSGEIWSSVCCPRLSFFYSRGSNLPIGGRPIHLLSQSHTFDMTMKPMNLD